MDNGDASISSGTGRETSGNGSPFDMNKWREPRAPISDGGMGGLLSEFMQHVLPGGGSSGGGSGGSGDGRESPAWMAAQSLLPCLKWLRTYPWDLVHKDVIAGCTVGIMLVPQGMAYAMIAGLPPQYGLCTSTHMT